MCQNNSPGICFSKLSISKNKMKLRGKNKQNYQDFDKNMKMKKQ